MWRWAVLQASTVLLVGGTLDFRIFSPTRQAQVQCVEYPKWTTDTLGRAFNTGWRAQNIMMQNLPSAVVPTFPTNSLLNTNEMLRRFDRYVPKAEDLVMEHAKLVQDINSLRQVVYLAPFVDDRDYDESIFHEIIETSTATTSRPTSPKPFQTIRTTRPSSFPIILVGGATQPKQVKTQPFRLVNPKPTISLIGTSVSPLLKHPYPFVMQASNRKPVKICMTSTPTMFTPTTRRPTLWERLINAIIPR